MRCYHLFIVEITVESVNLIHMSKQNRKLFRHDGEQLGFYKKVHQNTEQKEGCSLIFVLQETKNSNLFDKNCTQENMKCHMKKVDLDKS